MKILVTGNMGYVGPTVIAWLRSRYPDANLVGVDMGYFGHCLTGADSLPERQMSVQHFLDIRSMPADLLEGVDSVISLAAISNDPMGKVYETVTAEINCTAGIRLAKMAKEAGVRSFIFASSCSVYGFAEGAPRTEESELNPLTAYAKSKINSEHALKELASEEFVVTSLRFPTACGMSERLRLDLVLNDFVAASVAAKRIQILSDGTPWRPLIDTKDMARAIGWGIERDIDKGGEFLAINVGRNEWNYQVKDLAEAVKKVSPDVDIEINTNAQPDKRSYQVDFSRYKMLAPDHLPQVDLGQSIIELKEGLEKISFENAEFRNSWYMRLKVLSGLREKGLLNDRLEWSVTE